jgi:hypothetical protein
MPNMPRQPGDAVLCRDGRVTLDKQFVGYWWIDGNDLYWFGQTKPEWPETDCGEVGDIFRHNLKTRISEYFRSPQAPMAAKPGEVID